MSSGESSKSASRSSFATESTSSLMFSRKSILSTTYRSERHADSSFWNVRVVEDLVHLRREPLVELGDHRVDRGAIDLLALAAGLEHLGA